MRKKESFIQAFLCIKRTWIKSNKMQQQQNSLCEITIKNCNEMKLKISLNRFRGIKNILNLYELAREEVSLIENEGLKFKPINFIN